MFELMLFPLFFCYDVKQYEAALGNQDYYVREFASWQLNNTGFESADVILKLLQSSDPEVRMRTYPIFVRKVNRISSAVRREIQKSPSLEAFMFYFEPGDVYISDKFAQRVADDPELAYQLIRWGKHLGMIDEKEFISFDPDYVQKYNDGITKESLIEHVKSGTYYLRCRAMGEPDITDTTYMAKKNKPVLFKKGAPLRFPLVDMH
jgi:hypothetical protein